MGCKFSTYNTFMVFKNVLYFSVNEFSPQVLIILDVVAISVGRPSHAKVNSFPEQRKYVGLSYFKTLKALSICQN